MNIFQNHQKTPIIIKHLHLISPISPPPLSLLSLQMAATAKPPEHHHPLLGPTLPPTSFSSSLFVQSPPSKSPIDFSPPLIAMVVVAAAAFLFITYSRLISRHLFPPILRLYRHHRRHRRFLSPSDFGSPPPPYESSDGYYVYSPYGLDDSVIKNIPLTIYKFPKKLGFIEVDGFNDCAVCLVEFDEGESIRTLPHCRHSFHVDCIDMWLRSHATCPLCRTGVYQPPPPESPMSPVMAARIRPSFDAGIFLESMFLEPLPEVDGERNTGEIQEIFSPERRTIQSEDHRSNRGEFDYLLKRSYSFGFERSFPSERLIMEPATTPYHHRHRRSFFWTKRGSSTPFKSRVVSFRRTIKSPAIFRRRGYIQGWESSSTVGSSRRMKGLASPLFGRASSRMRMGDPEALISPERYNGR